MLGQTHFGGFMFGKKSDSKRVKEAASELAETMMLWGLDRGTATNYGLKFANQALENKVSNLRGMSEGENLAELYLSGREPQTPYGQLFIKIIEKYEPQRELDSVTPDDFYWYWSMPMLEREFIHAMSNAYRTGLTLVMLQSRDWQSEEEMWATSTLECDRNTVKYGLIAPENLDKKDKTRPIPFELYRRIEAYRAQPYPVEAKQRLIKLDNQNAFIREQIARAAL